VQRSIPSAIEALYVCPDALVNANRVRISIWALGVRLPTMFGFREYVDPAGLMSYGPSIPDLFRRAAEYVDKILAIPPRPDVRHNPECPDIFPGASTTGTTNGANAMANDTLINLIAWCKRERERLQMQREMLQSGRFQIFEKDDSGQQRNISDQHIEQIATNIAELDRIIAGSA
jgi:hypothetical protein